jgi:hypothetical protein
VELKGFDDTHAVESVAFQNVVVNGQPLSPGAGEDQRIRQRDHDPALENQLS